MSDIKIGAVVQFLEFKNQPDKARIYLVWDREYDGYSNNSISLNTALKMQERGLVKQIFEPKL